MIHIHTPRILFNTQFFVINHVNAKEKAKSKDKTSIIVNFKESGPYSVNCWVIKHLDKISFTNTIVVNEIPIVTTKVSKVDI